MPDNKKASRLLIIKNITREGPGLLEEVLEKRSISYDVIDLDRGEDLPDARGYGAIVVLGGPDSANDETVKMKKELAWIRETIAAEIPYLGICLGFQVLVKAAGGEVVGSPVREVGFIDQEGNRFTVELTENGRRDPLFNGLDRTFDVFQLHGETVELTNDITLLGVGKFCRNQIARVGTNAYGIQCHFELTPVMLETWMNEDTELLKLDKAQLRSNFEKIKNEYNRVGRQLLSNFLKIARF